MCVCVSKEDIDKVFAHTYAYCVFVPETERKLALVFWTCAMANLFSLENCLFIFFVVVVA